MKYRTKIPLNNRNTKTKVKRRDKVGIHGLQGRQHFHSDERSIEDVRGMNGRTESQLKEKRKNYCKRTLRDLMKENKVVIFLSLKTIIALVGNA